MSANPNLMNILTASPTMYCLGEYRPRRSNAHRDQFSSMIRMLKHNAPEAIEYFFPKLEPTLPAGWAVAVVPPHCAGPNDSGIAQLARAVSAQSRRFNAVDLLIRHRSIPRLASGGARTESTHFESIRVHDTYPIQDLNIVLLDDVLTTGCSMRACKTILLAAGAKYVLPVALGKTII